MIANPTPAPEPATSSRRPHGPDIDDGTPDGSAPADGDGAEAGAVPPGPDRGPVDLREALYNGGSRGTAGRIQLPCDRITSLGGFMLDLDPHLLRPGNGILEPSPDPAEFLHRITPVLDRHPLLRHAEVRASGSGLHLLVRIDPPVELHSHGQQRYWDAIVKAVQRTLPADPHAPGITALTRAVGSVNAKNGRPVVRLREGRPVEGRDVVGFVEEVAAAPFRTVAGILLGAGRVGCCPLCRQEGLTAYDKDGRCYRCGRVGLDRLFGAIYAGREPASEGAATRSRPRKGGSRGRRSRDGASVG